MSNTKKKILEVSLNLFSHNGYNAVSIRDICKEVEIKESSVYYHFKNKQAIFDELIMMFEEIGNQMMSKLEKALQDPDSMKGDFNKTITAHFFEQYLMDDFCNKVMRLMFIEQFNNDKIRKKYEKTMFDEPLNFQSKVLSFLQNMNLVLKTDSDYLAVKYYAPIYFFAQRWLFSDELTEERKAAFHKNANAHIQNFYKEIMVM